MSCCTTPERENLMTSILSSKSHHINGSEQTLHLCRKESLYGHMLSHVNYQRHEKVPRKHLKLLNEIDEIHWLSFATAKASL